MVTGNDVAPWGISELNAVSMGAEAPSTPTNIKQADDITYAYTVQ